MTNFIKLFISFIIISLVSSCGGVKKVDTRKVPISGPERAKKNVKEGRGVSLGAMVGGNRSTNYEFSTSNPMWRASLETLDFLPLSTVDYSGGVIITDWYSDSNSAKESIKISLRFLGNEIRSESLKVIVHQKTCSSNLNCRVILLSETKIKEELHAAILKKAALLEKESKKKKKK